MAKSQIVKIKRSTTKIVSNTEFGEITKASIQGQTPGTTNLFFKENVSVEVKPNESYEDKDSAK